MEPKGLPHNHHKADLHVFIVVKTFYSVSFETRTVQQPYQLVFKFLLPAIIYLFISAPQQANLFFPLVLVFFFRYYLALPFFF